MVAAVSLAAAGCQSEPVVTINPQDIIAPEIHSGGLPSDIVVTPTNQSEEITFTWSAADMGFGAQINYTVEMFIRTADEDGNEVESAKTAVSGGVASTSAVVNYEDVNYSLVYSLGAVPLEKVDVYFRIRAAVGTYKTYSDAVMINVTPTNAQKQFKHVYFIGSYCDWQHPDSQLLYDYDENGLKYQGVVDFGPEFMETTFQGFKLTAKDNWVEGEWGDAMTYDKKVDYASLPKDPAEVPLLTGGSGGNCERYTSSHRYYHFTMSAETLTLYMDAAFDQADLVLGDRIVPMTFHGKAHSQKFYADVEVNDGDIFKVVLSGKDVEDVVFGADADNTDGLLVRPAEGEPVKDVEVSVPAGNYRLYVNLNDWNAATYEFKAENYDTEEGAGPVVETYKGWALNGTFNQWKGNLPMEFDGTSWYVAKNVVLKRDQDFKFRKDGKDMTVFQGGGFAVDKATWQSHSGSHIIVTEDGTFDIYLNVTNGCCWFCTPGKTPQSGASVQRPEGMSDWSVCGTFNQWAENGEADLWMKQKGDWFVAENVTLAAETKFKIRELYRWDVSIKTHAGKPMEIDTAYPIAGEGVGDNAVVAQDGTYDIYMSYKHNTICLMTPGKEPLVYEEPTKPEDVVDWSICGSFNGWSDEFLVLDGEYYVIKGLELKAGDEFKFRYMQNWDWANLGLGASVDPDCCYTPVRGGSNFKVSADGTYDIYVYNGDMGRVYIMTAGNPIENATEVTINHGWGVSGEFNGWDAVWMEETEKWFVAKGVTMEAGSEFKLRFGTDWRDNRVASNATISAGKEYQVSKGDANMKIAASGTYDIYLSKNLSSMFVMNPGEEPVLEEKVRITVYGDVSKTKLYSWWDGTEEHVSNAWPGTPYSGTKTIGGVVYRVWYLNVGKERMASSKCRFIFNDGSDETKTLNSEAIALTQEMYLTISEGAPVIKDMTQTDPDPDQGGDTPVEGRTVTVYSASQNHGNLYMWIPGTETDLSNQWPGTQGTPLATALEYQGTTYRYKWVFENITVDKAQMILNNGSEQTEDSEVITLADNVYISFRSQLDEDESKYKHYIVWERNKVPVTVLCETSYTRLYGWWTDGGEWAGLWSGTLSSGTVQKDGVTYRKWDVWVDEEKFNSKVPVHYILNDGAGKQTEDSAAVVLSEETIIVAPADK